jgi:hypothetical protein
VSGAILFITKYNPEIRKCNEIKRSQKQIKMIMSAGGFLVLGKTTNMDMMNIFAIIAR